MVKHIGSTAMTTATFDRQVDGVYQAVDAWVAKEGDVRLAPTGLPIGPGILIVPCVSRWRRFMDLVRSRWMRGGFIVTAVRHERELHRISDPYAGALIRERREVCRRWGDPNGMV